ncbi:MAG: DHHA1 domain-containing protein [Thermoplasmata archaeon]
MREYLSTAKKIAETILKEKKILIASHIDADGITSAGIASKALDDANIENEVMFLKQLDEDSLKRIRDMNPSLVWFTDLGSGMVHEMHGIRAVITDHHSPSNLILNVPKERRKTLTEFFNEINKNEIIQLNPHFYGKDGGVDISGAGLTYLVAREISMMNVFLSQYAIVGAIGDLQDSTFLKLSGTNRYILKEAEEFGYIEAFLDGRFFGRETRPLFKMLEYTSDPIIPGITGDESGALDFLSSLSIELKNGDKWRRWVDLSHEEKNKILSQIVINLLHMGYGSSLVTRIIGEVYVLKSEEGGTYLRDAREFATLLNACGRYGNANVGLAVVRGDRDENYKKAVNLLTRHRKILVDGIEYLRDIGIVKLENLQYFNAGSHIPDTVVGTIASMALSSELADSGMPIIGFAENENGMVKVSGRASRNLVNKGLDLSKVISRAAVLVGGYGGGHNIAAGASIPKGTEDKFLEILVQLLKDSK